jgi:dipeptidase
MLSKMKDCFLFPLATLLALIIGVGFIHFGSADAKAACTSIIIGKNATKDGAVILAANDDWPGYPSHLLRVPGKRHKPGETFTTIRGGSIPQVARTYAYISASCVYDTGTRKNESWLFGMNENQVAVSMNGVYDCRTCFQNLDASGNLLECDDLSLLVLERAKTARQAVEMLGKLIDEYGFNNSSIWGAEGTATIAIADPHEGWWFEPVPGGQWVARGVPDNMASFRPNHYGIQEVILNDRNNFVLSEDLVSFATAQGWYDPAQGEPFNFSKAYSIAEWGSETEPGNNLRIWRMASLFSGQEQDPNRIVYEVPAQYITVQDAMVVLRDTLEGTEYDPRNKPEAGPYRNPFSEGYGSTISRSGTVVSLVAHLRSWLPNEIGGLMWVAFDTPTTSVYTPWYAGIFETPKAYQIGQALVYDVEAAWWNFQELGNLCYRRYNQAALQDVIPEWKEFESKLFADQETIEASAHALYNKRNPQRVMKFLNDYCNAIGIESVSKARVLANKLKGKYLDNSVLDW